MPEPRNATGRRADVQGLRAVAVLAVVAYHAGLGLDGGFLGVDVFFVVSGFVITRLLTAELDATDRVAFGTFYGRRARRLLPALAVMVPTVLLVNALVTNPFDAQPTAVRTAASAQFYLANLFLYRNTGYFDAGAAQNPFLHMWSLSVEEQFYLVFPLLLLLAWRSRKPMAVLAGAGTASFGLSLAMTAGHLTPLEVPERFAYFSSPTRAWEFVAGACLALWIGRRAPLNRRAATLSAAGGLVLLVAGVVMADGVSRFDTLVAIPPVAGTVLLLAAGPTGNPVSRVLGARVLTTVGDWSYAWYLWHWPAIVLAEAAWPGHRWLPPVAALAALAPAAASTHWWEARFRTGAMTPARTRRLVAACTTIPLLASVVAWSGSQSGWSVVVSNDWYDLPYGGRNGCALFNRDLGNEWKESTCIRRAPDPEATVLVLGDLAADAAAESVGEVARERGWTVAQWSRAGCPLTTRSPVDYPRCEEWVREAIALVDRLRPDVVVVANQSPAYLAADSSSPIEGPTGKAPGSGAERLDSWRAGVDGLLDELDRRRVGVVLVGAVPDYGTDFPRARTSVLRPHPPVPVLDRADVAARNGPAARIERDATARHPRATYVDTVPLLCTDVCRPEHDGRWWYHQPRELNRLGSLQLAPALGQAIDEVLPDR